MIKKHMGMIGWSIGLITAGLLWLPAQVLAGTCCHYNCSKVPSYSAIYNLLRQLDVDQFAEHLSLWLQQHTGSLPAALALDGKFIRDTVGIVCLADHETGVPRAMAKASKKEGEGKDCELKAAQRMIRREKDLTNTVITADPLHCQRETARDIVSRGGEFILQVKDNQKTVRKQAALKTREITPLLPRQKRATGG